MRISSQEELLETLPVELREKSKTGQAYIEVRRKILVGEYQPDQIILPRELEQTYYVSNTGAQNVLSRLAIEGLVKVLPIKKKTRATSAALGEYRVADIKMRNRMLTTRQGVNSSEKIPSIVEGINRAVLTFTFAEKFLGALLLRLPRTF